METFMKEIIKKIKWTGKEYINIKMETSTKDNLKVNKNYKLYYYFHFYYYYTDGDYHGKGKFTVKKDGSTYEGDYVNSKRHGQGIEIEVTKQITY